MTQRYLPIEDHAIIGNTLSCALVDTTGTVDFFSWPDFDSPTIFASLLDADKGGRFALNPESKVRTKQLYYPDTNVLLTRFLGDEGIVELTDCMPIDHLGPHPCIVRKLQGVRGKLKIKINVSPRFNYGREQHKAHRDHHGIIFDNNDGHTKAVLKIVGKDPRSFMKVKGRDAVGEITIGEDECVYFLLVCERSKALGWNEPEALETAIQRTIHYWREWVSQGRYEGRWREMVYRSALVLKLLSSYRQGSLIASATFGLPETIGSERNWDYRYTWIRDTSFTQYALIKMGFHSEAWNFMNWIENYCTDLAGNGSGPLKVLYRYNGETAPDEFILNHWEGYKGSSPVRVGNKAKDQLQTDIYGFLMDTISLVDRFIHPIQHDLWQKVITILQWLGENWERKDRGIWERRSKERHHHLSSLLMCWVAFDRAIKVARRRSFPSPIEKWRKARDTIYNLIFNEYFDKTRKCFVQDKHTGYLDASCLLMPLVKFISPVDPYWLSTLEAIEEDLVYDVLVRRYIPQQVDDGLSGVEGTFSICTFWYVDCLARAGQVEKAQLIFEKILSYANHVGLYSEELSLQGEHLGNFPQALTHLGLITSATNLHNVIEKEGLSIAGSHASPIKTSTAA